MLSPRKNKPSLSKMDRSPTKSNARGALINGSWHCDCEPRLPAEHFQTKNGGQNHGRWFYTCQKSQPKRCKFFLWDDDAKVRAESAVLNNSRSETGPKTPTKQAQAALHHGGIATPLSKSKPPSTSDESDFDWSASNDRALVEVAQSAVMAPPETPRKTPRTSQFTSPGKRNHSEMMEIKSCFSTSSNDDVFNTPGSSQDYSGLLSPVETPMREKPYAGIPPSTKSSLAADALSILKGSKVSPNAEEELIQLLKKHDLRMQGIAKGRDITRLVLTNKEKKIAELEARITGLEAERETSKAVIAHMKSDLVHQSPSKGRKRGS